MILLLFFWRLFLLICVVFFAILNQHPVTIDLYVYHITCPLSLIAAGLLFVGASLQSLYRVLLVLPQARRPWDA